MAEQQFKVNCVFYGILQNIRGQCACSALAKCIYVLSNNMFLALNACKMNAAFASVFFFGTYTHLAKHPVVSDFFCEIVCVYVYYSLS